MNAETKHGGAVDVLAVLRKASRSVPNDDFVAFDDVIGAVAELIAADREFDAAYAQYPLIGGSRAMIESAAASMNIAIDRRAAALANVRSAS